MGEELRSLLTFTLSLLRDYGLDDFYLELSTKPEGKAVGSDEEWDEGIEALREAALAMDLELVMDEGGGAFYGPKISVQARDAIGRTWQMSTIQVDFQMPQRFDLHYTGDDNAASPADHDPPRALRLDRAVLRRADRALRGRVPAVAGARAAAAGAGRRPARRGVRRARRAGPRRGAPRRDRRREGVGRQEDPRRAADEGAVHGGRGGPRPRGRHVHGPRSRRRSRPRASPFDAIVAALAEEADDAAPRADELRRQADDGPALEPVADGVHPGQQGRARRTRAACSARCSPARRPRRNGSSRATSTRS